MNVVLLVPESSDREAIAGWLAARGYQATASACAADALEALGPLGPLGPLGHDASFVFIDLVWRNEALSLLRTLVAQNRAACCIGIAARGDDAVTTEALRLGAVDVVTRPIREQDVLAALGNALEFAGLAARDPAPAAVAADPLCAQSPRMCEVYEMARRVAPSRCPVLIVGERGTGRETLARAIHSRGALREAAFVRLSGATPACELRQALDGAAPSTIYIEDLEDLPPEAQLALHRWLAVERDEPPPPHRAIAAAHPRIFGLLERRAFRQTLFDALSVVRFDLPTLRERPQDIPLLAVRFLKESCARHGVQAKTFSRSALALLASLPWRGNAVELRGLTARLALMVPRGVVLQEDVLQHVRFEGAQTAGAGTLREARQLFEREFIHSALRRNGWRIEAAATELGIERTNLYRKMKQLSITRGNR